MDRQRDEQDHEPVKHRCGNPPPPGRKFVIRTFVFDVLETLGGLALDVLDIDRGLIGVL